MAQLMETEPIEPMFMTGVARLLAEDGSQLHLDLGDGGRSFQAVIEKIAVATTWIPLC